MQLNHFFKRLFEGLEKLHNKVHTEKWTKMQDKKGEQ